jgi:cytochrome oxidase Cu insertion factor (SCO1/SenC/PrrC family)
MGLAMGIVAACLTCAGITLWWRSIQRVELAERRWLVNVMLWVAAGIGAIALLLDPGTFGQWFAGGSLGLGVVYSGLLAISGQSKQPPEFAIGSPIPDFTVPDENGEPFQIADLRGQPVLIKFFRGHW